MTSREERDRRRLERIEAEKREAAAERRRMILGYVVAGGLTLAVVVGIVIVIASGGGDDGATAQVDGNEVPELAFIEPQSGYLHGYAPDGREGTPPPPLAQGDLDLSARDAGCELELDLEDEGNTHIKSRDDTPDYGTNPPTSGDHWPEQLADGAFSEFPNPIYSIHSLEHGRIAIQYSPDLSEEDQLAIKGVFDEDPNGVLLFPNDEMPYDVAATAWTQKIGCQRFEGAATLDALRNFRDTYRGQGPESVPVMIPDQS